MADKLLIPIEVGGQAWLEKPGGGEEYITWVKFTAPRILAVSLFGKLGHCYNLTFNEPDSPGVDGSTYYIPPPSRFLPANASPEQQLEAGKLFAECCDRVRWGHRRALAGEWVGLPKENLEAVLMTEFRYGEYGFVFSSYYEDSTPLAALKGLNLDTFNEDERFYVKAIIAAIEAGTK